MKDMDTATERLIVQLAGLCGFAEQDDEQHAVIEARKVLEGLL